MGTISIIGLGNFACRLIDELSKFDQVEIFIADKDREVVERYRDKVKNADILDVINFDMLKKILPEDTTHAIVDLGHDNIETSILATNYLHKMGIKNIIVKSQGDTNAEILELVGATEVILPDLDAAEKITQFLVSSSVYDFLQVSDLFVMAEIKVKEEMSGKTLMESGFRQKYRLNAIAYREDESTQLALIKNPNLTLVTGMHILVAGTEVDIKEYLGTSEDSNSVSAKAKKLNLLDKALGFFRKKG